MPSCVIKKCRNSSAKENNGLSFHKFPRDPVMRKKWTKAVRISKGNDKWSPSNFCLICSAHFDEKYLYRTDTGRQRILKTAVPTKNILLSAKKEENYCEVKPVEHIIEEKPPESPNDLKNDPLLCLKVESCGSNDELDKQSNLIKNGSKLKSNKNDVDFNQKIEININDPTNGSHRETKLIKHDPSTSTDLVLNDSDLDSDDSETDLRYEKLKQKLKLMKRKLDNSQRQTKRLKKRNAFLVSIFKTLQYEDEDRPNPKKVKFQCEEFHRKLKENAIPTELFRSLYTSKRKMMKYTPEMKQFCLTLDFYSPNAYEFIRETFGSCLPHRKSLAKWHRGEETVGNDRENRQENVGNDLMNDESDVQESESENELCEL